MATQAKDLALTRGVLADADDTRVTIALPHTDYRLHLAVDGPVGSRVGKPITGRITATARRVDVVRTGGRFIEPVMGRPRRLQGTVVATDMSRHTLTVQCAAGCSFVCRLLDEQRPTDFGPGQLVAFDIERGAHFEPILQWSDD